MSRHTILIVDDEKKNVKLLGAILAPEHRILSANGGEEALAVVESEKLDLILLDVMMPGMDGIEVCRTLKSAEQSRMIPIIIVTALTDKEERIQAYNAGADEFLSKPIDRIELLGRTKSLLRIKSYYDREVRDRAVLRSVFDSISEPLIMVDQEMNRVLANSAADDCCSGKEHDRSLRTAFDHLRCEEMEDLLLEIQSSVHAANPLHREIGPLYTDNNVSYKEISVYPIKMDLPEPKQSIIRIGDVTERRLLAERKAQQERVETMGILMSSLRHQINNPHNFIYFNIPFLKEYIQSMISTIDRYSCNDRGLEICGMSYGEFKEDVANLIQTIERGSSRLHMIISKLQNFSQERFDGINESVNVATVIQKAISLSECEIKKTIKFLDVYVEPGLPRITGDQESLILAIVNILTNAAEAADKEQSTVKLSVRRDTLSDHNVIIEISDNGSGMDRITREKIFDAYFSTKSAIDGATIGMGIGLHASKKIIENMGGRILVDSVVNEGSTFKVVIPAKTT